MLICVLLLAAETMEGALEKNDFMDVFYNSFIEKLIAPVAGSDSTAAAAGDANNSSGSKAAARGAAGGGSSSSAAAPAAAGKAAGSSSSSEVPASTIGLIVDLLCFCVQHHAFWAKYHVLRCAWQ
jgi:protein phosphatase-4 regulatory subunit 3